jgi:hypothetical protein
MVFILSSGSDPLQNLQRFADEEGKKLIPIALGQSKFDITLRSGDYC